jgi:hypothetical protein
MLVEPGPSEIVRVTVDATPIKLNIPDPLSLATKIATGLLASCSYRRWHSGPFLDELDLRSLDSSLVSGKMVHLGGMHRLTS